MLGTAFKTNGRTYPNILISVAICRMWHQLWQVAISFKTNAQLVTGQIFTSNKFHIISMDPINVGELSFYPSKVGKALADLNYKFKPDISPPQYSFQVNISWSFLYYPLDCVSNVCN